MNDLKQFSYELNLDDILKLFNMILDKLDKQSAEQRSRKIKIDINNSSFPSLYAPKEFDDDKKVKGAILLFINENIFKIEESKKDSTRELDEKENAKLVFNYNWEKSLRLFYNRNLIKDDWVNIVKIKELKEKEERIVLSSRIKIQDKTDSEVIERLIQLLQDNNANKSIRHISAKYFWGLSKILDAKIEIIEYCKLRSSPVILHIKSFSNEFKNILFIENLDTYSEIIDSENLIFKDYLIIYSSGFKAAAKRLRTTHGSKLFFEGTCCLKNDGVHIFKDWLYQNEEKNFNVFFWGDLDNTGINIFLTIKNIFPELEIWRSGYEELIQATKNNDFHSPEESNKEGQLDISLTGNEYIDTKLLPILRNKKFVDQEYVDIEGLKL